MWLQKVNQLGYETLPHPPYSSVLSPTDYLFKYLDIFIKSQTYINQSAAEKDFSDFITSTIAEFLKPN